ncbi:MAG: hypothetical protein KAX77_00405 [Xanthomonadales bacterium]|nr:hypothetical protein [Xanthomonadales bacterium]
MDTMTCRHCIAARAAVWHGAYHHGCDECTARAIARSNAAIRALASWGDGNREPLDRLISLAMPGVASDIARRMVKTWWDRDHAATEQVSEPAT